MSSSIVFRHHAISVFSVLLQVTVVDKLRPDAAVYFEVCVGHARASTFDKTYGD